MTEKTNNKQKNKKIVLALVWNLRFVILDTKLQDRAGKL